MNAALAGEIAASQCVDHVHGLGKYRFADENLPAPCIFLEPFGHVDGIADCRVVHHVLHADVANDRFAGVNSDAKVQAGILRECSGKGAVYRYPHLRVKLCERAPSLGVKGVKLR